MDGSLRRLHRWLITSAALVGVLATALPTFAQLPALPTAFDWRNVGGHSYIGEVRDQGVNNDCYAYSAAAAAESAYNIAHGLRDGATIDLSESFIALSFGQLYPEDISGLNGAGYAYRELAALRDHGAPTEAVFPYVTEAPADGNYHWDAPRTHITQWYRLPVNDIETAQRAMQAYGALDVAVQTSSGFNNYSGGVYTDSLNSPDWPLEQYAFTDHGVALVGWDNSPAGGGPGYWILRNSWGSSWGESGYMRIGFTSAMVGTEMTYVRIGAWQGADVNWTNGGTINAAATVSDIGLPVARGFYAWGGTNSSALNSGSIAAIVNAPTGFAQAHGMYLWAEGNSWMSNTGTIHATAHSADDMSFAYGMLLQGRSLSNSGTVTSEAYSPVATATSYGMALFGYDNGTLTNTGIVSAWGYGGDGRAYGLYAVRLDTVDNQGNVQATGQTFAEGVTIVGLDHGNVINRAGGTIYAAVNADNGLAIGVHALRVDNLTNEGTITAYANGNGVSAYGVLLEGSGADGETRTMTNSGTISGYSTDPAGEAYSIVALANRTILTLQTGSLLHGTVGMFGTDDVLRLEGTGTEDDQIEGAETIVNAGDWAISSLRNLDNLVLESGTLSGPDMTVNGMLSGTGTLSGYSLTMKGLVAPGSTSNPIGTMTLQPSDAATFAPSSTLQIDVNSDSATPVAGVNNDLVHVQGQAVVNGGALDVRTVGNFTSNTPFTYTFLQTDNGLSVASPWTMASRSFQIATLGYDAYDYWVTLERLSFASAGRTANQQTVGGYFDANWTVDVDDFQSIILAVQDLTLDQAAASFDQMSPQLYGTLASQSIQDSSMTLRTVSENLRARNTMRLPVPPPEVANDPFGEVYRGQDSAGPAWRCWSAGYGLIGHSAGDGNASALDANSGGGLLALERVLSPEGQFGLFYGFARSDANIPGLGHGADISHHQFGTYLYQALDDNYVTMVAMFGPDEYRTLRRIQVGPIDRFARAEDGGWQGSMDIEAGRAIPWGDSFIQPYLGLQYIHLAQDSLQETGADSLNLFIHGRDVQSLRSILGTRFVSQLSPFTLGISRWELRAAWMHDYLDSPAESVVAEFPAVGPGAITTAGLGLGRDAALLGAGINWTLGKDVRLFVGYDAQFNERTIYHVGSGSLEYLW